MAYRCDSCGHFASLGEPEFDSETPECDGDTVTVAVHASYPSECCSDTVAEADYDASGDLGDFEHEGDCKGADFTCEVEETRAVDRYQRTDRRGNPITNPRYQRHYYGVEVDVNVTCQACEATGSITAVAEGSPPEAVY